MNYHVARDFRYEFPRHIQLLQADSTLRLLAGCRIG